VVGAEAIPASLDGRVATADGREVGSGPLRVLEAVAVGPATRVLASFEVPDLPAGDYLLRLELADPAGGLPIGQLAFSVVE
jgi:hypothetical protein